MSLTKDECIAAAGRALAEAHARREALSPRAAAEAAYRPGGPTVDELEARIRAQRSAPLEVRHGTHPEASKTHCKRGHPFDEANTYSTPGKRECRTCRRIHGAAHRRRRGIPARTLTAQI